MGNNGHNLQAYVASIVFINLESNQLEFQCHIKTGNILWIIISFAVLNAQ
jgi:hypothetical protein